MAYYTRPSREGAVWRQTYFSRRFSRLLAFLALVLLAAVQVLGVYYSPYYMTAKVFKIVGGLLLPVVAVSRFVRPGLDHDDLSTDGIPVGQ